LASKETIKYTQSAASDFGSCAFLYKENHALDAWFKKAYGNEQNPCYEKRAVRQLLKVT